MDRWLLDLKSNQKSLDLDCQDPWVDFSLCKVLRDTPTVRGGSSTMIGKMSFKTRGAVTRAEVR